jgi:beta-glucanase (GH16 family)
LPVCAEIVSRKSDFHYGTYRASIKITNKPGAVVGWFTYNGNPLNEIDIEFLTQEHRRAYFTLHHIQTGVDHANKVLDFDPSAAFHEYRFDWYPQKVDYYVDGVLVATLTKQVPDTPSRLLLNHWSGNIAGWGGPAPAEDVFMHVDWAYYSSEYRPPNLPVTLQPLVKRAISLFPLENRLFRGENRIQVLRDGRLFDMSGKPVP